MGHQNAVQCGDGAGSVGGKRIYQARSEGRKRDLLSTLQGSRG